MTSAQPAEPPGLAAGPRVPATDGERRALASVVRLRILRMCLYEPLTNKQIAQRLRRDPASVLHHVRTLVNHGFLQAGDPRSGPRGSREVPYRATGKSWRLDYGAPDGGPDPAADPVGDTMLQAFLDEVAQAPRGERSITRLGLQLTSEHHTELVDRLEALFREFAARPADPDGDRWSVFLEVHPDPDGDG
ncbi:ArsR/SmtB family transcription factor [Nakamurella endophytica]|uniref:ArsR/SmtB family transcription factor n=1 Tax=Nakamurella endophytica TaxID=1748367 RepID=UPI001E5960EA|nr:winged helix-turn-helix domain-containing protein [Nakamurella endophytica]